jgi:hypothetical protein
MPYAAGQHPPHLPRHLLFRILAYRLQANQLGDLERREVTVIFCDLVDSTGSWGQPPSSLAGVRFDGMSITFGCSLWVIPSDRAASSYHLLDLNFAFLTTPFVFWHPDCSVFVSIIALSYSSAAPNTIDKNGRLAAFCLATAITLITGMIFYTKSSGAL